jgi:hypothetical protein
VRRLLVLASAPCLLALVAGCPKPPPPQKTSPEASAPSLNKGVVRARPDTAPPADQKPSPDKPPAEAPGEPSLRAVREADRPILEAVIAYCRASDKEIRNLPSYPLLSVEDLGDKKPGDLDPDTIVYKVTVQKGHTIVLFGPPWSEYGLQFDMRESAKGDWVCTGYKELSGLEGFG